MAEPQPIAARDLLAAQGLEPAEDELALYDFLGPMLRAMTDALYAVEVDEL